MQPTAARSSRSSVVYPITPLTSAYVQHQPQRIVYAPIAIQGSNRSVQPNYLYSRNQKGVRQVAPMQSEGKVNGWPTKSKLFKNQQYCQQQFVHPPNPIVIYKQPVNNFYPSQNQSNTSFLLPSNFTSSPYAGEHYKSNITMLSQPYYKSSELQHPSALYSNQPQPQQINSYYMKGSNASNLQTMNVNPIYDQSTIQQYKTVSAFYPHNIHTVYPNMRMGLVVNESSNEKISATTINCTANKFLNNMVKVKSNNENNWLSQSLKMSPNDLYDVTNNKTSSENIQKTPDSKTHEEIMSEASSNSFDFTIEAEKMVSALCDVKSPNESKKSSEKVNLEDKEDNCWFLDVEKEEATGDNKSVATQTSEICSNETFSELMIRTALWGCTEAEILLKSSRYCEDSKYTWLTNLSSATKTAITKSSTSFPVFGGDRILVHDLINALLRISNGWLALDNYLNKPYYPSLDEKYDIELNRCFQNWESNTHDLLRSIVQTFQKIEKSTSFSDPEQKQETLNLSFPGDVSMYTRCDLFDPFVSHSAHQQSITSTRLSPITQSYSSSYFSQTPNFQYVNCHQNIKESKLRTKWTITENTSAAGNLSKQDNIKYCNNINCTNISFQQALNAELSNLKNKAMESGNFANTKQNEFNSHKVEFSFLNKNPFDFSIEGSMQPKLETNVQIQPATMADTLYFENKLFADSVNTGYSNCNFQTNAQTTEQKHPKYLNSNYKVDSIYFGKTNEFELVPKTKVTLLSQIEPKANGSGTNQQEMTAHLSAWFASMRNSEDTQNEKFPRAASYRQLDVARNASDLSRQLKMDANRQLLTLKNMQSIQSAPWSAFSLLNGGKNKIQKGPEECESLEDLRVYMKPGSYNVPKKRHQKKSKSYQSVSKNINRLNKNPTFRNKEVYDITSSMPLLSSVSISIPNNSNNQSLSSNIDQHSSLKKEDKSQQNENTTVFSNKHKDSSWKAACASAEMLLEALNVNKSNTDLNEVTEISGDELSTSKLSCLNKNEGKQISDISNCEISEDESFHSKQNIESVERNQEKSNIKTDSWLLKTLKIKNIDNTDKSITVNGRCTDSSNGIFQGDFQNLKCLNKKQDQNNSSEIRQFTYSDMTRKEFTKVSKIPPKHNSDGCSLSRISNSKTQDYNRKAVIKTNFKNYQVVKKNDKVNKWPPRDNASEEMNMQGNSFQLKKRKKVKIKDGLLPFNPKKKPTLTNLALDKLKIIHQAICQMEESYIFKRPSSLEDGWTSTPVIMMNEYKKVVKYPVFLETIAYKLKSHHYNKVENFTEDFRKIIQNSKLFYKNNENLMKKIDTLSQKVEELFMEHLTNDL